MKSQDMYQNSYGDETFYLTTDESVNFADTTKYIWKGGAKTILVNVALTGGNYLRLPEASTDNAGLRVKVIWGLSPGGLAYVGFVDTAIVGGAIGISDATEGSATANAALVSSAVGTANNRVELDVDADVRAGGYPGSTMEFIYTGVANVALYSGMLLGDVDTATLASHFSTTAVNA